MKLRTFTTLLLVTALLNITSCITPIVLKVDNPFRYDYDLGVTFLIWYGDPAFFLNVQHGTPLINTVDFNPLYREYLIMQNQKYQNDPNALHSINFSFSVDF